MDLLRVSLSYKRVKNEIEFYLGLTGQLSYHLKEYLAVLGRQDRRLQHVCRVVRLPDGRWINPLKVDARLVLVVQRYSFTQIPQEYQFQYLTGLAIEFNRSRIISQVKREHFVVVRERLSYSPDTVCIDLVLAQRDAFEITVQRKLPTELDRELISKLVSAQIN